MREQQYLVNQLIRNGVHQVESSAKQLQASQSIQTAVSNALAAKGLNDVNIFPSISKQFCFVFPFYFLYVIALTLIGCATFNSITILSLGYMKSEKKNPI